MPGKKYDPAICPPILRPIRWEPLYSFPLFLSVSSISTTNLSFFLLGSGTEGDSSRLNHVCLDHTPCSLTRIPHGEFFGDGSCALFLHRPRAHRLLPSLHLLAFPLLFSYTVQSTFISFRKKPILQNLPNFASCLEAFLPSAPLPLGGGNRCTLFLFSFPFPAFLRLICSSFYWDRAPREIARV